MGIVVGAYLAGQTGSYYLFHAVFDGLQERQQNCFRSIHPWLLKKLCGRHFVLAKSYLEFIVAPLVGHLHKKSADKFGEMLGLVVFC